MILLREIFLKSGIAVKLAKLDDLTDKPSTFVGYFRVWDEGHAVGAVHPSNPHHVFEIHPAWAFRGKGVSFSRVDLVDAMPNYRGFGFGKFGPLLKSLAIRMV